MSAQPEALRALVRELLTEALADQESVVSISSDADLNAFAGRLLELFERPDQRDAFRAGRLKFRLARAHGGRPSQPRAATPDVRIETGALTEKTVIAAAADGKAVVLGRRAVATPLALDKARSLGVAVRREAT